MLKLLGLNTLVEMLALLTKENETLKKSLSDLEVVVADLETKVNDMEAPDFDPDDFVREDDINDRIESYINDNDIVSQSYVDDEIESRVSDKVEEAIGDLDLTDQVEEVVKEMDKASFGDTEELKTIVRGEVKSFMLNNVEVDFIVR